MGVYVVIYILSFLNPVPGSGSGQDRENRSFPVSTQATPFHDDADKSHFTSLDREVAHYKVGNDSREAILLGS